MQPYKDYEECTRILQHGNSELLDQSAVLLTLLNKIEEGLSFFKVNWDFKKADVLTRRFENLKETALDKVQLRILKIIRHANAEHNLKVVETQIFDKATKLEDLEIAKLEPIIFRDAESMKHQSKNERFNFEIEEKGLFEEVKNLMNAIEERGRLNEQRYGA